MPKQRSLYNSDLRYMLRGSRRDRASARRHPLFWIACLFTVIVTVTWLATMPDASIENTSAIRIKQDSLKSQIAQVLDARRKALEVPLADHTIGEESNYSDPVSIVTASSDPVIPNDVATISAPTGTWPNLKGLPKVTISVSLDPSLISTTQPDSVEQPPQRANTITLASVVDEEAVTPHTAPQQWTEIDIRPGDSLVRIFKRLGLDPGVAVQIATHRKAKTLANLRIGPHLRIRIHDGQLVGLRYDRNLKTMLQVDAVQGKYRIQTVSRTFDIRRRKITGVIESSLYDSGIEAGLSRPLLHNLASIFDWQIDFGTDLQPGDRFAAIFEERLLEGKKIGTGSILAATFILSGKPYRAVRHLDSANNPRYFSADGSSVEGLFLHSPVRNSRITSGYSLRRYHPILKAWRPHRGLDFSGRTADPVRATADGKVMFAGRKGPYGKTIVLKHGSKYQTLYAHLSKFGSKIRRGRWVKQGQTIGFVGSTGLSTGPHLHYELRVHNRPQNPLKLKLPRAASVPKTERGVFLKKASRLTAELDRLVGV